ncbi:MAG TPA: hypothetical protein VJA94_14430 [Candidatus Angelobacter sp.]
MNESYGVAPSFEPKLTWSSLLAKTYQFYVQHFWTLFQIGLPVALLAYLFWYGKHFFVQALFNFLEKSFGPWWMTKLYLSWPVLTLLGFLEGVGYWVMSTVFFTAIAARILKNGEEDAPISDSYSPVRQRLGAVVVVGVLTWTVFWIARSIVMAAVSMLLEGFNVRVGSATWYISSSAALLILGGLCSRAGLAIPVLVNNATMSPLKAIRGSIRKMENWEPFFIFFLAKSALFGYGVYWLAQRAFAELWNRTPIDASAYSWVTWAVYICIAAALESPLFIAFSILYRELNAKQGEVITAPAIR